MSKEPAAGRPGQHGDAVLGAFATANHDLVAPEVDVFHTQFGAFEQSEARTVQQERDELWAAIETIEDRADLLPRQHDRQPLRSLSPHDVIEPRELLLEDDPIEEYESIERLILGRRGHARVYGQRREKACDFGRGHLGGMPLVMEEDVALDPVDVGFLGLTAVMTGANGVTDAIEQARARIRRRRRFVDCEHDRR
jgi:hypothetical protein